MTSFHSIKFEEGTVGMRVQDYWGRAGTVRWIGHIKKKDKSPTRDPGHYFGVEFDEPSNNPLRGSGAWCGETYFTCPERCGMLVRPQDLYPEVNPTYVKRLREHFGERVQDWHDFELVKFSIARQFDWDKIVAMLEKHLQWRAEFKPAWDEYYPQTIPDDYPCGYTGTADLDENLIYCERPSNAGACHPSEFVRKYTLPVIARWHATGVEMGIRRFRETNYRCKRLCYIVDLKNVNAMTKPMIGFAQTLASVEQDNYPENLGRVFIVNCPMFFRFAWKLVKMFIDERTNKKINFVPPNQAYDALKAVMPESEIPDFCGGTSTKWRETNGARLGSDDPSKAHKWDDDKTAVAAADTVDDDDDELGKTQLEAMAGPLSPATSDANHVGSPNTATSPTEGNQANQNQQQQQQRGEPHGKSVSAGDKQSRGS